MLILAMDTSSEHGSIALARGPELIESVAIEAPQGFSRVLFEEIRALLGRHRATLREAGLFAAAAGPGSFTGVRVGLAAAKGMAAAQGTKVVPVSNLAAIAAAAAADSGGPRILIPVLDARRGEVYAGIYERIADQASADGNRLLRCLAPEAVLSPAALDERLSGLNLPPEETAFCGPDLDALALARFHRVATARALAGAIARLAWGASERGEALDPAAVDANYVRRSF